MFTNTDSLTNKITELQNFCSENKIDIVAICETLPKNNNCDNQDIKFVLEGYASIQNNTGRGVVIFYKETLTVTDIHCTVPSAIFCKIKTNNKGHFTFGLVYRSPNNTQDEDENLVSYLHFLLEKVDPVKEKFVLLGDFNLPNIDWDQETCSNNENHINSKFLNFVHEYFLNQLINKPTHFRADQAPTLIDLIITNDSEFISNVNHSPPFGLSHHDVLTFVLNINQSKIELPPKIVYLMNKGDYPALNKYLKDQNWDFLLEITDVNIMWENIENIFQTARDKFIPTAVIKKSNISYKNKFPIPDTLLELFHHKRAAFKHWKKYPTNENKNIYNTFRAKVNSEVKRAKREKEEMIAKKSKLNPKIVYQYISQQSKPRDPVANLQKEDGSLTETDSEKAEVLNSFFSSVFVNEGDSPSPPFKSNNENVLNNVEVTVDEMTKKLKSLNVNKSPGPDGLHPRFLFETSEAIAYPLKLLFDATMKSGKIPAKWKIAEVKPLFKKGKRSEAGNYRPVSLTSIICKVFESFLRDALYLHLTSNDQLSPHQFGFCKGRSCTTQLLNVLDNWFYYLDQNIPVDAIYLDFKKAFDSVPHKRLIEKLKGYGIKDNLLSWIQDFLSERTQYVTVNNNKSQSVPVTSGVPQGSVLGPTLFIYFINDLPSVCEALVKIFADDAKSFNYILSEEDCLKLQRTLNSLKEWSNIWLLDFNATKCNVLHLGKNNKKYQYYMKNGDELTKLNKSEFEKDLGVNIDTNLDFKIHIKTTVKKARSAAGIINRHIINKTPKFMVQLFKSMVRPIIEYANVVWAPYLKKDIVLLESVQRHFTKKISGMKDKSYEERLIYLKLPSLQYRRLRGDLIEVYKILHNIYDPVTTKKLLTKVPSTSVTRKSNSLNLTKQRTNKNAYKNFFTNRINNVWNNLPNDIVNAKSLNIFKNRIDFHFRDIKYKYYGQ